MPERLPLTAERLPLAADDNRITLLADALLSRHERAEHEDNVRQAVRDFLIGTGLSDADEIVSEASPGPSRLSRRRVDLRLADAFCEVKRRIGTVGCAATPAPQHIAQLDEYLAEASDVHIGVLTDGRHWLLRSPGSQGQIGSKLETGPQRQTGSRLETGSPALDRCTGPPWMFTLGGSGDGLALYRWLSEYVFSGARGKQIRADDIGEEFGPSNPVYAGHIGLLGGLYREHRGSEAVGLKRDLWKTLLEVALGEIVGVGDEGSLDDLFVRHTYLVAVIGMITQASYGVDIASAAEHDPSDLLFGGRFLEQTGIRGVIDSDFFSWPAEVSGGDCVIKELAARVASYDWSDSHAGLASALYQSVMPTTERELLGEYYTPQWLAEAMVREVVPKPLEQRVLDPACGSGRFLTTAIEHLLEAAAEAGLDDSETLSLLQNSVTGIDIHPVAVHLARSEWVLAARRSIAAAADPADVSPPVYLGDSLQLLTRPGELLGQTQVTIDIAGDASNRQLVFPRSLVERPEVFDPAMTAVAAAIRAGDDPEACLGDYEITESECEVLQPTLQVLHDLHSEGRDHIWSYFTRNLVRPIAIAERKADVIIGNPPWITYNQTVSHLREKLRELSTGYGIWDGGRYATHADTAGLFFTRCVHLYLATGGECAMVLPHSALGSGHYAKWRTGRWASAEDSSSIDFAARDAWDLESLQPNDFFPVPACVVFGRRADADKAAALQGRVQRWTGTPGADGTHGTDGMTRTLAELAPAGGFLSPYASLARQGATIVPRRLFLVEERPNPALIKARRTITVSPRRSSHDKAPWSDLDLGYPTNTVEDKHVFDIALGETIVPYVCLPPLKGVLPVSDWRIDSDESEASTRDVRSESLAPRVRNRWAKMRDLWDQNKSANNRLTLLEQIDYMSKLSSQLAWRSDTNRTSVLRVVYASSGQPTAAVCEDEDAIIDYTLFWVQCDTIAEARYLTGVINSRVLRERVEPLMPKGQWGSRHVQKHLWKLPIPRFDPGDPAYLEVAVTADAATRGAGAVLDAKRSSLPNGTALTSRAARGSVREWLQMSQEGRAVEEAVASIFSPAHRMCP